MKTYIWEDLPLVSSSYHCGGGAVVIAKDRTRAVIILMQAVEKDLDERCRDMEGFKIDSEPYVVDGGTEEKVIIFPNAGCC